MKYPVFPLLLGWILFTLACRNQPTKQQNLPDAVTLIASAADTAWVEKGIDAVPEADAIFLEWTPAEDGLAANYAVWRQDANTDFQQVAVVNSATTEYLDAAVQLFVRYRYIILPVSDEGDLGEAVDTLSYRLLAKATDLAATQGSQPEFSWRDPNLPPEAAYLIRLKQSGSELRLWQRVVTSSYTGDRESVVYNDDGSAVQNELTKGTEYLWRIDILGSEANSGSESPWNSLRIQ